MSGRIACFGELLLRLGAPGRELLLQSPRLEVVVGGAEANVAVSLARFGHPVAMLGTVADNALGHAALGELRRHGVDTAPVRLAAGRMGLYFLATGAGYRPSEVLYDRAGSAFATAPADAYDWPALLRGAGWLHVSGVTPALGPPTAAAAADAVRAAVAAGLRVSFDGNFRPSLWAAWGADPAPLLRPLLDGAEIAFEGADRLIAVELEALRHIPVTIGVAIGSDKVESIIAGARGGYFNQLVTDPATAEAILARLEDSGV